MIKCTACKKEFPKDEQGEDLIGIKFTNCAKYCRKQYPDIVQVCYDCWFKSIGVKPLKQ